MKNEKLFYIGIGVIILLVIGIIALDIFILITSEKSKQVKENIVDLDLDKYRGENIPEKCRLPIYENDINWWKQHLSHHGITLHCLDYYKEVE
ncbi:hypothetical protein GOV12_04155 [Candidatus Pacearchaeota archaeon]|nr:hypothetical protein [Candidatus Pacearchaeota archaeon]